MRLKHHKQIVNMLYDEWDLGKSSSATRGKTCAWIYWFEILSDAEQIITKKQGSNIIGVCGYTKWNSKKHFIRKNFYSALKNILAHSPLVGNKKALKKYGDTYDYVPQNLRSHFDGEVTIIIIDKRHRGHKIGQKMLAEIFKLAQEDNMRNLQICTDESCNYKFYDIMGCEKVYEKMISGGEPKNAYQEKVFVYEKELK